LSISSNCELKAEALTSVGGNLSISSNCELKAEALTSVGGYLYIYSNCELKALTSVGGDLSISSNCELKALTSVGGYLSISSNCELKAEALTSVGGYLSISSNCELKAEALTSVGGYLFISSNVKLNIKCLQKINYKVFDNVVYLVESEKTSKGIKIYTGGNITSIIDCKPIIEKMFVAEKGEFVAHGLTIKKSIQDLQFKIISETLKKEPIKADTLFTVKYYRLLTGACDIGVRDWMQNNNMPFKVIEGETVGETITVEETPITAKELLPILEKSNAYGFEKFKSLITF
jgi:hypothetical protein